LERPPVPYGYLIVLALVAAGLAAAVRPMGRSGPRGVVSWLASTVINESPFVALHWLAAATLLAWWLGDLTEPVLWLAVAVAVAGVAAGLVIVRRSVQAGPVIDRALAEGLGAGWSGSVPDRQRRPRRRLPWVRILIAPLPILPLDLRRTANLSYGPAGRRNHLDVIRSRRRRAAGPILIHLHGGYFRTGRKNVESRPLLHGLARAGWVCVTANYRLRPEATYADMLTDTKKVIAWVKANARRYGADPSSVFIAGSSAGAHLAVTAALTASDPRLQPGFERLDTTVAGAIGLYGYYGPVDGTEPGLVTRSRIVGRSAGAPPIFIAHGDQDTLVAPANPRRFVARLRATGTHTVVYAELPGAQHSFDLVHSIRFETLVGAIEAFARGPGGPRARCRVRSGWNRVANGL
jgi:acetyl esterase/lipase